MRVLVTIMTCQRPRLAERLVDDIQNDESDACVDVRVCDDGSNPRPSLPDDVEYMRSDTPHGKSRFSEWVSECYASLRGRDYDYYIFLPDDVRLCRRFVERAVVLWERIEDPNKIALTVHTDADTEHPRWTNIQPTRHGDVWKTQWVDGHIIVTKTYLEQLDFQASSSLHNRDIPGQGSGVGATISRKLHSKGWSMYRVHESLVCSVATKSIMNPTIRRRQRQIAIRFVDGWQRHRELAVTEPVSVGMASIPGRVEALERAVHSLLFQVDKVYVYLNGYDSVPSFLNSDKIVTKISGVDKGDAGKFYWGEKAPDGFYLSCDDDIIYPSDYVLRMCYAVEVYNRKAALSIHGGVLKRHPVHSYYKDRHAYHCRHELHEDKPVHFIGTGVAAFHTSQLRPPWSAFKAPNMADVWFSLYAQERQIPLVCCAHKAEWVRMMDVGPTIAKARRNNDSVETEVVNSRQWILHKSD